MDFEALKLREIWSRMFVEKRHRKPNKSAKSVDRRILRSLERSINIFEVSSIVKERLVRWLDHANYDLIPGEP